MHGRQQGVTAIGFIVIAAIIAIFGFAALKLVPIYLQQMKVASVLRDVKSNLDGQNPSITEIRSAIGKRFNIEMLNRKVFTGNSDIAREIGPKDVKIGKTEDGFMVQISYEDREPYLANLYLVAVVDNSIEINR